MTRRIFVYGSLKTGGRLHRFYLARAVRVSAAAVVFDLALWDLGRFFPIATVRGGAGRTLRGEVYYVDETTWAAIDAMERAAGYRVMQRFASEPGRSGARGLGAVSLWAYDAVPPLMEPAVTLVESGEWPVTPEGQAALRAPRCLRCHEQHLTRDCPRDPFKDAHPMTEEPTDA